MSKGYTILYVFLNIHILMNYVSRLHYGHEKRDLTNLPIFKSSFRIQSYKSKIKMLLYFSYKITHFNDCM